MIHPRAVILQNYEVNLVQSNNREKELYSKTSRAEHLFALARLFIHLLLFGLIAIPVELLLLGGYFFFSFMQSMAGFVNPYAQELQLPPFPIGFFVPLWGFVTGFLLWIVPIVWIGAAIYRTYVNVRTSEKNRLGEDSGSRDIAWSLGAREYTSSEYSEIRNALIRIQDRSPKELEVHNRWWVIDAITPQAFTLGSDLYITTEAITGANGAWLEPILAHELGHLAHKDGWTLAALRGFISPFMLYRMTNLSNLSKGTVGGRKVASDIESFREGLENAINTLIYGLWFGGLGVAKYSPEWAQWFRERDYLADEFVTGLGIGDRLHKYLKDTPQLNLAVPFSGSWTQYTALRVDRIELKRQGLAVPTS